MAGLVEKVTQINEDFLAVSDQIKKVERRMGTLETHLTQYDSYKKHKAVYDKYKQLDPKKAEAFYDKHYEAIQAYEAARDYLKGVMGEHKTVPVKAWQDEQKKLTAERTRLCEKYYTLKDETKDVETLIRGADNIIKDETRETPTRKQNVEL